MLGLEAKFSELQLGGRGGSEDGWSQSGSVISMMSKISALETELAKLRGGREHGLVAVVGGLSGYDGEACKSWLVWKLEEQGGDKCMDVLEKGLVGNDVGEVRVGECTGQCVKTIEDMGIKRVWAGPGRPFLIVNAGSEDIAC